MRVGNGKILEDALDRAILSERPMQGVERNIRLELGEHPTDIATDIDAGDLVTFLFKRIGTGIPRRK
ncbi:hypothetical protein GCM10007937_05440 [Mesorhizobium albiziae]|nr:hypothetical protein GCM10007937_05440 [Mesorhizobium albiziae]